MRRRLILLVTATVVLVLVAFAVPLGMLLYSANAERVMSTATQEAEGIVTTVATTERDTVEAAVNIVDSDYPITVYWPDGSTTGNPADRSAAVELASTGRSITAETDGGREILFGVHTADSEDGEDAVVVRTFVSDSDLLDGLGQSYLIMGIIALALLGVAVLIANWLARLLLGPVRELSDVSHQLASGDLQARATQSGPRELRDVAGALNGLAGRIQTMLETERERVADLSHRLRTPLTVLRLEAESISDPAERTEIESAVDEVEVAVNQAIDTARNPTIASPSGARGPATIDAAAVVGERVKFWSALAEDTNRTCYTDLVLGPISVRASAADLSAAMDAALGNVFAHTPEGTAFTVRLERLPTGGAAIEILDEGPGLPNYDVLQRGQSGGGSTGLGLDIIRRTAAQSGGEVAIGPGPTGIGTRVRMVLG